MGVPDFPSLPQCLSNQRGNSRSRNQSERKEFWILNLVQLMPIIYKYVNTICAYCMLYTLKCTAEMAGTSMTLIYACTTLIASLSPTGRDGSVSTQAEMCSGSKICCYCSYRLSTVRKATMKTIALSGCSLENSTAEKVIT